MPFLNFNIFEVVTKEQINKFTENFLCFCRRQIFYEKNSKFNIEKKFEKFRKTLPEKFKLLEKIIKN